MTAVLEGEVALVTGASRGLGRAIALHLAGAGCAVALLARTTTELQELERGIRARGGRALAVSADVTQRAKVECAVGAASTRFGPISILVNCAGQAGPFGPIGVVDPDAWWQAQALHVRGALLTISAVLPGMRARGGGRIVNVSSRAGLEVMPGLSSYCVAKATQIRLTEHVDAEQRAHGIRAFAIQPGTVITDMARASMADPDAQKWAPFLVEGLRALLEEDPVPGLARVGEFVVAVTCGKYDALAGRYLDIDADLAAQLREAQEGGA